MLGAWDIEKLPMQTSNQVDILVRSQLGLLHSGFETKGDPHSVRLAGEQLIALLKTFHSSEMSLQFGRLQGFLAELRLAEAQDSESLRAGLILLNDAVENHYRIGVVSEEVIQTQIRFALHTAIIVKALNHPDDALNYIGTFARRMREQLNVPQVYLVPLERQRAIIHQDEKLFEQLVRSASSYRVGSPVEYFTTLKRSFEHALNAENIDAASKLYPLVRQAYAVVRHKLPPLNHVAFAKNVGHYLALLSTYRRSQDILKVAGEQAERLNFYGQLRHIRAIQNGVPSRFATGLRF